MSSIDTDAANAEAFRRLDQSDPVLTDIRPGIEVLPNMAENIILTSGPVLPWEEYTGGQADAVIGGALFEGLAASREEAVAKLAAGEIVVGGCHDYGCVGSLAGIYTASMPVFVVENRAFGNTGYCNFYEGTNPRRLNYGVYDDGVRDRLLYIQDVIAPVLAAVVRRSGGIPLKPIMKRAVHMGDEMHSRSTAAALIFTRELVPHLLAHAEADRAGVEKTVEALTEDHYFFLRLSMGAGKAVADAAHGVEGSSVVTAMGFSCKEFGIRVSGLGEQWFCGPHAQVQAKLFDGHSEDEITWMGGESPITETMGLGGFAQAASFPLQAYQGGEPMAMVERNEELYRITVGENSEYRIPFLKYRGTPTGIDIFKVLETGILPCMDIGVAGRDGGQIGAGVVRASKACFEKAAEAYKASYGG